MGKALVTSWRRVGGRKCPDSPKKTDGRRFRRLKRMGALLDVAAHVEGVEGVTAVEIPTL